LEDARPPYEEAVKIYRQLAQQNPGAYLPDLAGTLTNLGILDGLQKRAEGSRADYTEALTIYRRLAQGDPARYSGDAARVGASLQKLNAIGALPAGRTK
jgi:tetratricopeptide (TPR) repeat protein